jgi:polysaccharide pyruvyl transferase WcaK-like protein
VFGESAGLRRGVTKRDGTITLGMLWHSVNSGNLGVGALTVSNLVIARAAAAAAGLTPHFKIMGFVDEGLPIYVGGSDIEVVALGSRAMLPGGGFWRALDDVDCVLDIGGGDSFTDIYPTKRFAYIWLTKQIALWKHRPLVFSPQTIGPFSKQPQTALAAGLMRKAELIVARDPMSFDVARKMAPDRSLLQAVDVAFALPFARRAKASDGPLEIGLNVSALLFNGGHTGRNEFGLEVDYAAYSRALIAALLVRPGVRVSLISHVYSDGEPHEDDWRTAEQLKTAFPALNLAPKFASPSDAKSYISGLDFLVAGRMHACIAAFSSGVPVVPVAYSRKFTGLFEGVLDYRHIVPVRGLSTEAAVAFTLDRLDQRESLAAEIAQGMTKVDGLLGAYREALTDIFKRLP